MGENMTHNDITGIVSKKPIRFIILLIILIIASALVILIPKKIKKTDYSINKIDIDVQTINIIDNGPNASDRYSMDIYVSFSNRTKSSIISTYGAIVLEDNNKNELINVNVQLPGVIAGNSQIIEMPLNLEESSNLEPYLRDVSDYRLYFIIYKIDYNNSNDDYIENVTKRILLKKFDKSFEIQKKYVENDLGVVKQDSIDDQFSDNYNDPYYVEYSYDDITNQVEVRDNYEAYYYGSYGNEIGWLTPKNEYVEIYEKPGLFDCIGIIREKCELAYYDTYDSIIGMWYCISVDGNQWVVGNDVVLLG